jgi:hypothetical protein
MSPISRIRALRWARRAAWGLGTAGVVVWFVSLLWNLRFTPEIYEPYQRYGGSFGHLQAVVFTLYGLLWLIGFAAGYRAIRDPELTTKFVVIALFNGMLLMFAAAGACLGIECLNALLDVSPLRETPVHVSKTWEEKRLNKSGAPYHVKMAAVNRLDHPDERVVLNWDSCDIKYAAERSRAATIRIGRGAFGIPWVALPVGCQALTVDERPLFGDFVLGKRGTAVIFVVQLYDPALSDGYDFHESTSAFPTWRRAVEATAPQVPLVMIWSGDRPDKASAFACPRCKLVHDSDVDPQILALFTGTSSEASDDRVWVANAQGKRIVDSRMFDTDQLPAFIEALRPAAK